MEEKDYRSFENKYCRMCACELKQSVFIFGEEGKRLQIAEKIRKAMSILIFEEDTLPKKICMECCSQLELFSQYKENCLIAQDKFHSIAVSLEKAQEKIHNSPQKSTFPSPSSAPSNEPTALLVNETGRTDDSGRHKMKACTNNLRIRCGFCRESFENHDDLNLHQDNFHEKLKHREPFIECIECQRKFNGFESLYCHYEKSYRFNPPEKYPSPKRIFSPPKDDSEPVNMRIIDKRSPPMNLSPPLHMSPTPTIENNDSDSDSRIIEDDSLNLIVEEPEVTKQKKSKKGKKEPIIYPKRQVPQKKPKNDGVWKCDICDKILATYNGLQGHIDIHNGKRFNCDMCDATYSQKSSLVHHKNVHHLNISKKHKCSECGKDFFELKHLNEHLKLHNTPSPEFACPVCKKTFSTGRLLRRHSRYHNGVKPFKCRFCAKGFLVKSKCGEHENSHTDKRPFGCSFCEKGFNSHANYLKHVRRKHPEHVTDNKCPPPKKISNSSTTNQNSTTSSSPSTNSQNNQSKVNSEDNFESSSLSIGMSNTENYNNWENENIQEIQTAPQNLHQEAQNNNNGNNNVFHHQSHHHLTNNQSGHHPQQGNPNYHQNHHHSNMNGHCSQNAHQHQQNSRHGSMNQHGQSLQGMKMGNFHNALDLMDSTIQNALNNSEANDHLGQSSSQSEPMELSYKLDEGFQEMPMELTKVFQRDPLELCVRQEFAPLIDLSSRVGLTLTNDTHMGLGINVHKLDMTERELMDMSGAFRQPIDLRNEEVPEICNEGNLVDLSLRSSFVQDHSASSFLRELIDLSARSDTFHGELNLTNKHQGHNSQTSNSSQNLSYQQQQQHLPRTSNSSIPSLQNIIYQDTIFSIQN